MLEAALLSKSTYYFEINKPDIDIKNEEIIEKINDIFCENKKRYGVRRITAELNNQGIVINHKKVQRIMNKFGLKAIKTRVKYHSYMVISRITLSIEILKHLSLMKNGQPMYLNLIVHLARHIYLQFLICMEPTLLRGIFHCHLI